MLLRRGGEAVEGPVAALHRIALLVHGVAHVEAVRDAGRVRQDERGARPGRCFLQRPNRLHLVGPQGDLRHVHVAVLHGEGPEVLLRGPLPGGRELGDRGARRGLGCLSPGVGVHLGVEHDDVHVRAGCEDVVQAAVADVVGPAVAADDPQVGPHEGGGQRTEVLCPRVAVSGLETAEQLGHAVPLRGDPLLGRLVRVTQGGH